MLRRLVHDEPGALLAVVQEDIFRLVPRDLPLFSADPAAGDNACKLLGAVLRGVVAGELYTAGEAEGGPEVVHEDEVYLYNLLAIQVCGVGVDVCVWGGAGSVRV